MPASSYVLFVLSSLAVGLTSQTAVASAHRGSLVEPPAADPQAQSATAPAATAPQSATAPAATAPASQASSEPVTMGSNQAPPESTQPAEPRPEPTFVGGFAGRSGTPVPKGSRLGIGATLGYTSGLGLSLRRHFHSGLGLHVGGFGIWTEAHRHLNLATQLLYTFYRSRVTRVYALAGVAWHVNRDQRGVELPPDPDQPADAPRPMRTEDYFSHRLIFGPGIGGELYLHPRFTMSLEVPLAVTISQVGEKNPGRSFEDRLSIHPGVNASMHFYF